MCHSWAWNDLPSNSGGFPGSLRLPRISLMSSELVKCDECEEDVIIIKRGVTCGKCSPDRKESKINNSMEILAFSQHDLFEDQLKVSPHLCPHETPPLYEELCPFMSKSLGMQTLDMRGGLSRLKIEKENMRFYQKEAELSDDDSLEKFSEEINIRESSTLDVRKGLSKSRIEDEIKEFDVDSHHAEDNLGNVNEVYKFDGDCDKADAGEPANESNISDSCIVMANRKPKSSKVTKLLERKLNRIACLILCTTQEKTRNKTML